ncbi:transglycosylase domain-containing protein [Actinacidiphila oryziradicis]|uniref:Penicillin-binding protein n=1 Tax=Actinacidiphila oryziradicis TaxID=2571141 RepID=A0A4U0SXG5_9ACTN|nr:transglycosylase domain-containing protein [Actinacidiphila oryziradicis]TKA13441.1 penicillin-binding protein [Actinacidiphila oryziradicis]
MSSSNASSGWSPSAGGRNPRRTGLRRLFPTWRMTAGGILLLLLVLSALFIAGYLLVKIPSANAGAIAQSNVYLYSDGSQLARDGQVNREIVPLSQVSKTAQRATFAAEDRNFYHESAVSPKAMLRAAWNTASGKGTQSGSTITQQYVKNYYLDQDQTATRKVKEFFIALKLDRNKTKAQILEGYLNTSYYGRNAYGIQAAAQAYFNTDANKLNTAQGAYLATLLNAPSEYDVIAHPENKAAAQARWDYVMDGMVKERWLTATERRATKFPAVDKAKGDTSMSGQRGYLVEAVKTYLSDNKIVDEETLRSGGYRITTSIDKNKEKDFVNAAKNQLLNTLNPKARKVDSYVRAGGASIDPNTGQVVAMYGGIDYTKQYVNNATRRDYQVGSTFKPFIFASAVQNGSTTQDGRKITPYTVYNGTNKREVVGLSGPTGYAPANEDDVSYGSITATSAMDKSVNAVYAQMAQDVGPAKVKATAVALGLPSDTPDLTTNPSMALGTATASPLDMAQAYATLANHGRYTPYTLVVKITKNGHALTLPQRTAKQVVSREAADTTTSILRSVVNGGTATAAQASGVPSAGKTGTMEQDKAAWFAGYTPNLASVVAVMGQDSNTGKQEPLYGTTGLARVNGGGYPTQIWAAYTADALSGQSAQNFDLSLEQGASAPPATTHAPQTSAPPTTTAPDTTAPPVTTTAPDTTAPPPDTTAPPATTVPPTESTVGGTDAGAGAGGATTGGDTPGVPGQ